MSPKLLRKSKWRWRVLALALYLIIAVASTWPLARHCASALPMGTEPKATVPLLLTWTIWWNADRSVHRYEDYWNAPIFHPTDGTFALSEPMPTTIVAAPIIWLTGSRVLAQNVLLLLALTLNGWSSFLLLRRVRVSWIPSLLGGAIIEMLPMVHNEVGVLQLVPLCGIIWTLHALYHFSKRPAPVRAVLLGVAFAFTFLTCAYHGLFLSVLLPIAGGWLLFGREEGAEKGVRHHLCKAPEEPVPGKWCLTPFSLTPLSRGLLSRWGLLLGAVGVAAVLIGPVVLAQRRVIAEHDLQRSPELISRLSAKPSEYLVSPWPYLVEPAALRDLRETSRFQLNPGWIKLALAALGIIVGFRIRRFRRWTAFCTTMLLVAFALSFGPKIDLAGFKPYQILMDWYPGFAQARSVFRFAFFVQLITGLLAALGLQGIAWMGRCACCLKSQSRCGRFRQFVVPSIVAAAGILAAIEVVPARQRLFEVPSVDQQLGWINWLDKKTPEDCVLVCLPFTKGRTASDFEDAAMWMYWGTYHRRPMVNGYSGFFPKSFLDLKKTMQQFPDRRSIQMLREYGVDYCVVRNGEDIDWLNEFELVHRDEAAAVAIYRLH